MINRRILLLILDIAITFVFASTSLNRDVSAQTHSWRRVHIADSVNLSSICFADSLIGYVAGVRTVHPLNVVFYRTTDGGEQWVWTPLIINGREAAFETATVPIILAPSDSIVYLINVGNYVLLRSTNKGQSWDSLEGTQRNSYPANNYTMWSNAIGGRLNTVLNGIEVTNDSGRAYSSKGHNTETFSSYYASRAVPAWADSLNWIFPTVIDTATNGLLLTRDAGLHWALDTLPPDSLLGVQAACANSALHKIWVLSSAAFSRTSSSRLALLRYSNDTGKSWTAFSDKLPFFVQKLITTGASELWLSGFTPNGAKGPWPANQMYHSTDDGRSWTIDSLAFAAANLTDFYFSDPRHGWALSDTNSLPGFWDNLVKSDVYIYQAPAAGVAVAHTAVRGFQIYPNPSSRSVTIIADDSSAPVDISVVDALGRTTMRSTMRGKTLVLQTGDWTDGYYQITLQTPQSGIRHQGFLKISN